MRTNVSSTINAYRPEATGCCCRHRPRNPLPPCLCTCLHPSLPAYTSAFSRNAEAFLLFCIHEFHGQGCSKMSESLEWKYLTHPFQSPRRDIAAMRSRSARFLVGAYTPVHPPSCLIYAHLLTQFVGRSATEGWNTRVYFYDPATRYVFAKESRSYRITLSIYAIGKIAFSRVKDGKGDPWNLPHHFSYRAECIYSILKSRKPFHVSHLINDKDKRIHLFF